MQQNNAGGFEDLTKRAQQVAAEMSAAGRDLANAESSGTGGAGLVQAYVGTNGRVTEVRIDPMLFDPDDLPGLADAMAEAVNTALDALAASRADHVGRVTDGMSEMLEVLRARLPRPS